MNEPLGEFLCAGARKCLIGSVVDPLFDNGEQGHLVIPLGGSKPSHRLTPRVRYKDLLLTLLSERQR